MEKLIEALVDAVWVECYRRKGFDDWWDSLEEETRAEIKDALGYRIRETLRATPGMTFQIQGDVTGLVQGNHLNVSMDFR